MRVSTTVEEREREIVEREEDRHPGTGKRYVWVCTEREKKN